MTSQPSLFTDFEPVPTLTHTIPVRSHLRRVKGTEPLRATAPSNGTATSQAAAESLTTEHLQNQERRVLDALHTAGQAGLTREQLADITGIRLTDICRAVNGLAGATRGAQRAGRVPRVADGPDTRKSRAGRAQKVVRGI